MNTVEIIQDDNAVNPRQDFDNFGYMVLLVTPLFIG
jgi:hypothetical protein